jgi:tetratricopeptide (TPR) repeat protein
MAAGERGPADVQSLVDRADALNDRGQYQEGLRAAQEAVAIAADHGPAWTALGWALENLGRLQEAEAAYRSADRHDPGQPWALVGLATVLEQTGRPEEAQDIYRAIAERAAQRKNMGPDLLEIVGWSCFKAGNLPDALALYRDALALEPGRTAVRFDLALALLAAEEHDAALAEYRTGLRDRGHPAALRAHVEVALEDLLATPWGEPGRGSVKAAGQPADRWACLPAGICLQSAVPIADGAGRTGMHHCCRRSPMGGPAAARATTGSRAGSTRVPIWPG